MSNPIFIATSVPGLLHHTARMKELALSVLNKCDYIILERDDYLRGIDEPSLETVKHKRIIFIRQDTAYLDTIQELKRASRSNAVLAGVLEEIKSKNEKVVILGRQFFGTLADYVQEESELQAISYELQKMLATEREIT